MRGKPLLNLVGKKFNKLLVIRAYKRNINNRMLWDCLCDCGNHIYLT